MIWVLKVTAACLYGWWYAKLPGDQADTWWFYREALQYREMLMQTPLRFWSELFESDPNNPGGFFHHRGFWNDLRGNVFIRFFSILLLLSAGNYYVASLFFAMIGFWSSYLFCKIFVQLTSRPIGWIEALFLTSLPSVLFWTSGIHRDAILMLCLSGICWQMVRQIQSPKWINGLYVLLLLLPILIFRSYWALILFPTLLAWFLTQPYKKSWTLPALLVANGAALALFLSNQALLEQLVENRQAFLNLEGKSLLRNLTLLPNPMSFLQQVPQALTNFFWMPTQSWRQGPLYGLSQLEMALMALLLSATFIQQGRTKVSTPTLSFLIAIFCMMLMAGCLIGWTIPYAGAMVRYRAPFLALMSLGIWLSRKQI